MNSRQFAAAAAAALAAVDDGQLDFARATKQPAAAAAKAASTGSQRGSCSRVEPELISG